MKIIRSLSRLFGYVAMGMLGFMMLLTVADVSLRYLFNAPITGATELSEFMMVIVVFPAFAWVAVERSHIRVDLLISTWSRRVQLIVEIFVLLLSLGTYCIIAWRAFIESMNVVTTSSLLSVPHSPFYWIMTVGFIMLCLAIISLVIEDVAFLGKKRKRGRKDES
jgi:TRAP-type C4-dicarboxylate transport system permease small subunit